MISPDLFRWRTNLCQVIRKTRRTSHAAKNASIKETAPAQTANYGVSAWRRFLFDGTIITVGVQQSI